MDLIDLGRADYSWTHVTDTPAFRGRDGAGALVFHDRMFLLGGWHPNDPFYYPRTCVNDVWSSSDGVVWRLEKPNTYSSTPFWLLGRDWEGTHTAGYAVYRDRMWIIGGDPLQGHYQPDVWSSADGRDWTFVNRDRPVPWQPRCLHHTFVLNDKLWVLGGQTLPQFAPAPERFYHDLWCSEDGIDWQQVTMRAPFSPCRGMYGGYAVLHGRVWLLGGGTYSTPGRPGYVYYNDVWSSADGIDWRQHLAAAPWQPRVYHAVATFDERLWVLAGQTPNGNCNTVWYSSDGVSWYEVEQTPWGRRHAPSVFVYDNALWLMCGSHLQPDVWRLDRLDGAAGR